MGDEQRDVGELIEVDSCLVAAERERGGDFFECGVSGSFADVVDRAFDLVGAGKDGGERVGGREAEVIVAVR